MKKTLRALLAAAALAGSMSAGATDLVASTLTFDDLDASTIGAQLPDGYGGFNWGDRWYYMSTEAAPTNTFLASSTVGSFFIARADGSDFHFDGADFFSRRGLDANGDFFFVLYHDGQTVYQGNLLDSNDGRMRFSGIPTLLTPGYTGPIDGMAFGFDNDDYDHLAMDNFRFRAEAVASVPEPGSWAMLGAGLALLGGIAHRRNRSTV